MNLPNRLTLARVILAPVYMLLFLWDFPFHYLCAGLVFGAAALTDMFDGKIARKRGLITDFGKFVDPIADKMLTTAAFIGLMTVGQFSPWAMLLVLTREFAVASMRMLAASGGKVIAASMWGKVKTVAQFVAIIASMAALEFSTWQQGVFSAFSLPDAVFTIPLAITYAFEWIATVLTVLSGIDYLYKNRHCFTGGNL